jgi:hypothetical protein
MKLLKLPFVCEATVTVWPVRSLTRTTGVPGGATPAVPTTHVTGWVASKPGIPIGVAVGSKSAGCGRFGS